MLRPSSQSKRQQEVHIRRARLAQDRSSCDGHLPTDLNRIFHRLLGHLRLSLTKEKREAVKSYTAANRPQAKLTF